MPAQFFHRPFDAWLMLEPGVDPNNRYQYYYWKWGAPPVLEATFENGSYTYGGVITNTTLEYIFNISETATNFVFGECTALPGYIESNECICFIASVDYGGETVSVSNLFDSDDIKRPKCFIFFSFNTNCKDFVFYEHGKEMIAPSCRMQYGQDTYNPNLKEHDCIEMLSQDTYGNLYVLQTNPINESLGVEVFTHAANVYGGAL